MPTFIALHPPNHHLAMRRFNFKPAQNSRQLREFHALGKARNMDSLANHIGIVDAKSDRMKPYLSNNRSAALSRFEVLMAIVAALILGAILLLILSRSQRTRNHLSCASNLQQMGLGFRIWEGDNGDKYPMAVSATNGGAMELMAGGM